MNLTERIQGARDFSLNNTGLRWAREAATALALLEPSLIVSPLLARTRQVAETFSSLVGIDVEADDRLKERSFGFFEGLTGAEIEERSPEQYHTWRQAKEPGGVGAEQQTGVGRWASRTIEDWVAKMNGTLVIVSRGTATKLATISLLGKVPGEWMGLEVVPSYNWVILEPLRVGPPAWRTTARSVGVDKSDEVRTPAQ